METPITTSLIARAAALLSVVGLLAALQVALSLELKPAPPAAVAVSAQASAVQMTKKPAASSMLAVSGYVIAKDKLD